MFQVTAFCVVNDELVTGVTATKSLCLTTLPYVRDKGRESKLP